MLRSREAPPPGPEPMATEVGAPSGRMSLMEHLTELRRRLLVSLLTVGVGTVTCWILYPWILDFLLEPYCEVQGETVAGGVFG